MQLVLTAAKAAAGSAQKSPRGSKRTQKKEGWPGCQFTEDALTQRGTEAHRCSSHCVRSARSLSHQRSRGQCCTEAHAVMEGTVQLGMGLEKGLAKARGLESLHRQSRSPRLWQTSSGHRCQRKQRARVDCWCHPLQRLRSQLPPQLCAWRPDRRLLGETASSTTQARMRGRRLE
jgi:hypothetical protein